MTPITVKGYLFRHYFEG